MQLLLLSPFVVPLLFSRVFSFFKTASDVVSLVTGNVLCSRTQNMGKMSQTRACEEVVQKFVTLSTDIGFCIFFCVNSVS